MGGSGDWKRKAVGEMGGIEFARASQATYSEARTDEQCFGCGDALVEGETFLVNGRTSVPRWYIKRVCGSCLKAVVIAGSMLVEVEDEYWTLRPRMVKAPA